MPVDSLFVSAIVPINNKDIPEPLGCGTVRDRNVATYIIIYHRPCTLLPVDSLFVSAIVPINNKVIPEPLGCELLEIEMWLLTSLFTTGHAHYCQLILYLFQL